MEAARCGARGGGAAAAASAAHLVSEQAGESVVHEAGERIVGGVEVVEQRQVDDAGGQVPGELLRGGSHNCTEEECLPGLCRRPLDK